MAVATDIASPKEFADSPAPRRWGIRRSFSPKEKVAMSLGMTLAATMLLIWPYPLPALVAVLLSVLLTDSATRGISRP
jgi:hypothetical protein